MQRWVQRCLLRECSSRAAEFNPGEDCHWLGLGCLHGPDLARSAGLYLILLDRVPILLALAQGRFETLVPNQTHQASQSSRLHASKTRRPSQKGWAWGEEDRETLPLPPMCSAVPRPRCYS